MIPWVPFDRALAEPLRNGVYKPKQFHGSGVPVINMKELFAYERIDDQAGDRVVLSPSELLKAGVRTGDLLFARRSFVLEGAGKCSIIGRPSEPTTFESSMIRARPDPVRAVSSYLFYFFGSSLGRAAMASIATRTAVSGITGSSLAKLEVPLPPLPTQCKIAAILSAYDDLIENNNWRIKLLEEMAQRIYREWFVDFRYPGHEGVPLVDSELGPIPQGWEVLPFTDIAEVLSGGTPRTSEAEYWGGAIPFFTPRDAPDSLVVVSTEKGITQRGLARCNSRLYPVGTVFITARGTVGKAAIAGVPMAMNQSCYALRGIDRAQEYVLFALLAQVQYLKTNTGGATFDTVIVDTFRRMRVASPPADLIRDFSALVAPLLAAVHVLTRSTSNLRATRDMLLPRLVSGEIEVDDLHIEVPAAA